MHYFVSYARRDNGPERLRIIREHLARDGRYVYIDDLEPHRVGADRVQAVINALAIADTFIAVESSDYLKTEWTRWEFETALRMKIKMTALLPDFTCTGDSEHTWPWPDYSPIGTTLLPPGEATERRSTEADLNTALH
ncbi:toll/interleukin-1 receptor domain-containing protein [Streptomyces sp. NPDC007907]|uniref:toll/interleukin-1 receptor domain-containing protein n=1 Tax=Streptomyces sp. NPDC007907 TaxID=3364789 RepID=UPI0036E8CFF9